MLQLSLSLSLSLFDLSKSGMGFVLNFPSRRDPSDLEIVSFNFQVLAITVKAREKHRNLFRGFQLRLIGVDAGQKNH